VSVPPQRGDGSILLVVVDMQRVFGEATPWQAPRFGAILPTIERLVAARPADTVFTRFLTPESPEAATGCWRDYYRRWSAVTLREMDAAMLDLAPPLRRFVPPAEICDKTTYSAFESEAFRQALLRRQPRALALCGTETDVCVLATALAAIDRGLGVILLEDALTSSSESAHGAVLEALAPRLPEQIERSTAAAFLARWARVSRGASSANPSSGREGPWPSR
jgi:nicotinamidase-related amidase